jgi:hypothetical protein
MADLTDEQCDDFRRLPGSFNDMVRAIYRAGRESTATPPADAALIGKLRHQLAQVTEECAALRARAVPAFVPYTEKELRDWFPVMCNCCGWHGLSRDCTGGGPIADTGDFNEITCPKCWMDGEGKAVVPREVVVEGRATAVPDDTAMLDWLDKQREDMVQNNNGEPELYAHAWGVYGRCNTVREAICDEMLAAILSATDSEVKK